MSANAEIRNTTEQAHPGESYDRVIKAVHWSTVLLIAAAYAAVWASHVVETREQHAVLVQLHRSLGVSVFGLTLFRLAWRWHARIPRLPADLPALQRMAARATEYVLYALLLGQPILGILHSNARGARVSLYFFGELPVVISPDKVLARQFIAAHELVAVILLAIITLHTVAALFHHFVRRDGILIAMLPGRR